MHENNKISFRRALFLSFNGIVFIALLLFTISWIFSEINRHRDNIFALQQEALRAQKKQLKSVVDNVIHNIEFFRSINTEIPDRELQDRILDKIAEIRFSRGGYVFVNRTDGRALVFDGKRVKTNKNIRDMTDPTGLRIFDLELNAIRKPDGGYISYMFKRIDTNSPEPKISYIKGFDDWKWIIGAGSYVNDLTKEIEAEKKELIKSLEQKIIMIGMLFIFISMVLFIIANKGSSIVKKQLNLIDGIFRASIDGKDAGLIMDSFDFKEVSQLAQKIIKLLDEQKEAKEALKKSEERFRKFVEGDISGDYITTPESFVYCNKRFLNIFGYKDIEEINQAGLHKLYRDKHGRNEFISKIKKLGKVENSEVEMLDRDGNIVNVIENAFGEFDKEGNLLRIYGYLIDITENKRMERALRESEEKFRSVVENSHDGIFIVNDNFKIIYVNNEFFNIMGYANEEIINQDFRNFLDKDEIHRISDFYIRRQKGEKVPLRYEFNVVRKGGAKRLVEVKSVVTTGVDGKVRTIAQILDITNQRRAEKTKIAAYRVAEAAFTAENISELFNSIHKIISELMPVRNFCISLYNKDSNKLTWPYFIDEYDRKPLPRKPGNGLVEYVFRTGEPLLATPEKCMELVSKGEVELKGKKFVDWLGIPLKTGGETIGVLAVKSYSNNLRYGEEEKRMLVFVSTQIATAIERKEAQQKIKRDLIEKEILLKEVHHRVKNNLQVIYSLLNLQSKRVNNKELSALLEVSKNRVRSMALIHEKFYQSKEVSRVDFSEYINSLARDLYKLFGISRSRIRLQVSADNVKLGLDQAVPCGLIINEIISNSLKYAFPDNKEGRIDVNFKLTEEDHYRLEIRDNGVGLPGDLSIEETSSLGLRLVKLLTEQLEGDLKIISQSGTAFIITFRSLVRESLEQ